MQVAGLFSQEEIAAQVAAGQATELTALAGAAASAVTAGGQELAAAEKLLRDGLLRLGAGMLENLLAADSGYAGPQLACGAGHQARFAGYRPTRTGNPSATRTAGG